MSYFSQNPIYQSLGIDSPGPHLLSFTDGEIAGRQ